MSPIVRVFVTCRFTDVKLDRRAAPVFRGRYLPVVHWSGHIVQRMIALVRKFWTDETGATAIECGLIAAGISLAIIVIVNGIGSHVNAKFTSINTSLK
jgi:pilus assembly protein Flp/PilA